MKTEEFIKILTTEGKKVNTQIKSFLNKKAREVKKLGETHSQYYHNISEFILRGGKRLRPVALIMAYKAVVNTPENSIYLPSISIELLHNATLVHDDIIDHDDVRRGGPTFHRKYSEIFKKKTETHDDFGVSVGILGGNSCFNLGIESILKSAFNSEEKLKALSYYSKGFQEVIDGVFLESIMQINRESTEKEYLTMIKLKTSALFEKGILIGATLGGAEQSQINALGKYAVLTGQAFQIQDDILGTFGVEKVTGKPADSDIKEGKLNILSIKAFEIADKREKEKLNSIYGNSEATSKEIEYVRSYLREKRILDYCTKLSNKLANQAIKALDKTDPPLKQESIEFFKRLSDFVIKRSK
ncbi:MAG: polyprenyl synthetase family protein [Candidatus Odinarchaeia archaeon]